MHKEKEVLVRHLTRMQMVLGTLILNTEKIKKKKNRIYYKSYIQ